MDFLYMGFTQEASIRSFRFECQIGSSRPSAALRRTVNFVVSADISLFSRYGIPIQEGPSISRDILVKAAAGIPESELVSATYPVVEEHMGSIAAARTAAAEAKTARRRFHQPPPKHA